MAAAFLPFGAAFLGAVLAAGFFAGLAFFFVLLFFGLLFFALLAAAGLLTLPLVAFLVGDLLAFLTPETSSQMLGVTKRASRRQAVVPSIGVLQRHLNEHICNKSRTVPGKPGFEQSMTRIDLIC